MKEVPAYLAWGVPGEEPTENVKVITRKVLFSRYLEFSVEREDYVRAASLYRSDLKNLIFGLKSYRKFHPSEP